MLNVFIKYKGIVFSLLDDIMLFDTFESQELIPLIKSYRTFIVIYYMKINDFTDCPALLKCLDGFIQEHSSKA
jgi:hypothetical protein